MDPEVSIVILNHNHPELIATCLETLRQTESVAYETVVVDNGSEPPMHQLLAQYHDNGHITTLCPEPVNHFFSEGNNIGVRHSNPRSEYLLLLNNDVAFLRCDWLSKMLEWINGLPEYQPNVWGFKPTCPSPGPRDIVSIGWSYDEHLPSKARPEGWCCLFRRRAWRDLSPDFPFYYGFEEAVARSIREGSVAGVLSQYSPYLVHRECGSGGAALAHLMVNKRTPAMAEWFAGLDVESLDFTLGPDEHSSYLIW